MTKEAQSDKQPKLTEWMRFLKGCPPGRVHKVSKVFTYSSVDYNYSLNLPKLKLHCDSDICNGIRQFSSGNTFQTGGGNVFHELFLEYVCNNCQKNRKTYAVFVKPIDESDDAEVIKLGEYPPLGSNIPTKLITIIGSNREYFLQGWRAENLGMGIGAFTYYRRVVENQKDKLIDKIINVAKSIQAPQEMINNLEWAKKETQFSTAVAKIKDAIPESLKIKTHNPLRLIHSALSVGIHNQTDEECLERAKQIRVILTEFSERLSQALKDDAELNQAISMLTEASQTKKTEQGKKQD